MLGHVGDQFILGRDGVAVVTVTASFHRAGTNGFIACYEYTVGHGFFLSLEALAECPAAFWSLAVSLSISMAASGHISAQSLHPTHFAESVSSG